ncbi:TatD family hydrolase [Candidatus Woesearchaeota archaeon]|nr:TatD family hydrolase [Candidatus Woesearchaeota archaeon]
MYVDVHAHLDHFDSNDLRVIIENAKNAGLKAIITNGINPKTNRTALKLVKEYSIVKAALGLYPIDALKLKSEEIDAELKYIYGARDQIVAVGEVGLDYYWDQTKNKEQREIFSKVIKLCEKIRKPIIVHSRKAEVDVISMLESSSIKKVIMHCFGGRLSLTKQARDHGYYFSIPTNIVKSMHFQRIVEELPIGQILTETDSPYLGIVNGKGNEPANVVEGVNKIAEVKSLDAEECKKMIYQNYQKVF